MYVAVYVHMYARGAVQADVWHCAAFLTSFSLEFCVPNTFTVGTLHAYTVGSLRGSPYFTHLLWICSTPFLWVLISVQIP